MDKDLAIAALAALAHPTRLDVFRVLVTASPDGLLAGEIGERLGVLQNTMSTNLAILARAGLIGADREGRTVRYRADLVGIRSLIVYLMQDCCEGRPEICAPLAELVSCCG